MTLENFQNKLRDVRILQEIFQSHAFLMSQSSKRRAYGVKRIKFIFVDKNSGTRVRASLLFQVVFISLMKPISISFFLKFSVELLAAALPMVHL